MASSQVASGAIPQPSFAGLGRRFWAHIIDKLIALAVLLAVSFAMRRLRAAGVWTAPAEPDPIAVWHAMAIPAKLSIIVVFIISLGPIYLAFFEASAWQASIGKRMLGIYVTDVSGTKPTLGRSLARSFAKCFFDACYVWVISLMTIASSAQKQAVHDAIAKTIVLRGRPSADRGLETWEVIAAFGIPFLWLLITFLMVFRTLSPPTPMLLTHGISSTKPSVCTNVPPGIREFGAKNFDGEAIKSDCPVLVVFWAAWAGPSRMAALVVDQIAVKYQGRLIVAKVNVDREQVIAKTLGITAVPSFLFFKNGKVVTKLVGYLPREALEKAADATLRAE